MNTHKCRICRKQVVLECFDYDECGNNTQSNGDDMNIQELLEKRMPLPKGVELLKNGEWEELSETAREAANRTEFVYGGDPFWTVGWDDLIPRLRIPE